MVYNSIYVPSLFKLRPSKNEKMNAMKFHFQLLFFGGVILIYA